MAKCQIIRNCGTKRRVCRDSKGRIKSNTVISGGSKRKAGKRKRKAGKRKAAKRRGGKKRVRALAKNIHCVRTRVKGKCRQICYRRKGRKNRMVSNDAAKNCGKRAIVLS